MLDDALVRSIQKHQPPIKLCLELEINNAVDWIRIAARLTKLNNINELAIKSKYFSIDTTPTLDLYDLPGKSLEMLRLFVPLKLIGSRQSFSRLHTLHLSTRVIDAKSARILATLIKNSPLKKFWHHFSKSIIKTPPDVCEAVYLTLFNAVAESPTLVDCSFLDVPFTPAIFAALQSLFLKTKSI